MVQRSERDVRMGELHRKWEPVPVDVTTFGVDADTAKAEHDTLDWESLTAQFPLQEGATYPHPTFKKFVEMSKAGAAQLHGDKYLAEKEARIVAVEAMDPDAYARFIGDRPVDKDTLLSALHGRLENEKSALNRLFVGITAMRLPHLLKRGYEYGEGKVAVPARLFTGLNTARTIYEGSSFQLEGNYLVPIWDHQEGVTAVAPVDRLLVPRQMANA